MRLFVAISPPPPCWTSWTNWSGRCRAGRHDLRWTNREAWHVTLAFLGQVDETAAARLLPRLERAAGRHAESRLAFAGAGAFPAPAGRTCCGAACPVTAARWAGWPNRWRPGRASAGAPPPDRGRRFQPHLTLARCRMPADVTSLVTALGGYQGQPWTADRLHLVRSRLGAPTSPGTSRWAAGRSGRGRKTHRSRSGLAELLQDGHRGPERGPLRRGQLASLRASQASFRRRTRCTTARPSSVTVRMTWRRSVGCGERSDELALLEHRDDPGHGGRLDLLVLGELARRHRVVHLQSGQRGQLGLRKHGLGHARGGALGPQAPGKPAHGDPERGGQPGISLGLSASS